jgi:hypothetical protein
MVKTGNLENPGTGTSLGTLNISGTYNAGDDAGSLYVRHRHPINVPLNVFDGDRALQIDPKAWQNWDPAIKWVDIPLLHRTKTGGEGQGNPDNTGGGGTQTYDIDDGIDCLSCHRAHGTDARMSGYANSDSNIMPERDTGIAGTPPTNDSALLRADNRGVCERCHNK